MDDQSVSPLPKNRLNTFLDYLLDVFLNIKTIASYYKLDYGT
jgi:hypothetical protein